MCAFDCVLKKKKKRGYLGILGMPKLIGVVKLGKGRMKLKERATNSKSTIFFSLFHCVAKKTSTDCFSTKENAV